MTLDANIRALADYFMAVDSSMKFTGKGYFSPSEIPEVYSALSRIIEMLDMSKVFLDAGSGDGRIVALAAIMGFEVIGIEYDAALVAGSRKHISDLQAMGIVTTRATIQQGDFTNSEIYLKAGIRFNEIGTVYAFLSNPLVTVEMIDKNSSPGTKLLLLAVADPLLFPWMNLERRIPTRPRDTSYIWVYSKRD